MLRQVALRLAEVFIAAAAVVGRTEADAPRAATEVPVPKLRRLAVVDRGVVVPLVGEDLELRRQVFVERAVAVQVVRGKVDEDRALRREVVGVLELEGHHRALGNAERRGGGEDRVVSGDDPLA